MTVTNKHHQLDTRNCISKIFGVSRIAHFKIHIGMAAETQHEQPLSRFLLEETEEIELLSLQDNNGAVQT